jgi:hypothetical protein
MITTLAGGGDTRFSEALLIIDAPSVDAAVGGRLERAPRRDERFNPGALSAWMAEKAGGTVDHPVVTTKTLLRTGRDCHTAAIPSHDDTVVIRLLELAGIDEVWERNE